jgi:prefoldin subunit 5
MKFITALLATAAVGVEVTPVTKVIQLLNGMLEKGKNEKHAEQVQFAAYKQWCDDTTVEKQRTISEANDRIEKLGADIQKAETDAAQLGRDVQEHDANIATFQGDVKAATKVRDIENTDYLATHKDYSESIDALERAIAVLKRQNFDRRQATAALAQVIALNKLSAAQQQKVMLFLKQDPEVGLGVEAPEANAYEFQSSSVIDMLEKLRVKFLDERTAMEKEETSARHAHDMLVQDLRAQITSEEKGSKEKSETRSKKLQSAAENKSELSDTTTTRDDDQKYLTDISATCQQKAGDFSQRQELRAEELEAIEKAIEILGSDSVKGNAEKHLPALAQATSLLQLRAGRKLGSRNVDDQLRVADFLRNEGERLHSSVLSAIAVRAPTDPFDKVKQMIKDLVVRLMEEANEEAEHKGWCDTELGTNEATRKEKTEAVETLHSTIDGLEASIAKLGQDISGLTASIAEIDAAVAKAVKLREEEHATNEQTVQDAQDAQTAVQQALLVLHEFYAKAGEATALVQQPAVFDSPYRGMGAESGGVIGMLEVIESDFARLESETAAAEAQASKEHSDFMSDSAVDKAAKGRDVEHKTSKRQNQEQALQEAKTDLEGTQKELDAALAYFDKLKPSCIDAGVSYEDRVTRRKEEIQSLQEALRILNGEDIA